MVVTKILSTFDGEFTLSVLNTLFIFPTCLSVPLQTFPYIPNTTQTKNNSHVYNNTQKL